jgi:biotin synthase
MKLYYLIDKLSEEHDLTYEELLELLNQRNDNCDYLFKEARKITNEYFSNKIFIRGLLEFSNFCKNDCYYCGIHKSNLNISRYRLSEEEIISCCHNGYKLGCRTFVLQSGEDLGRSNNELCNTIKKISRAFPDCAITLSIGEKSFNIYKSFFKSGATRYLLRYETANNSLYKRLHPSNMFLSNRKKCLGLLKQIGYQVGTGFMVGLPFQSLEDLVQDIKFLKKVSPAMVGIGPFIPHKDTKFANYIHGTSELTIFLIGIIRLMLPNALIPATTALATIDNFGREKAILAGANVLMPNISPMYTRKKYLLYDNKVCTGEKASECMICLNKRLNKIGYKIIIDRGDYKKINNDC